MASSFKKDRSKIRLITEIDMLLIAEKGIRGGIFSAVHLYAKANNKDMKKIMIKIKNNHILIIRM